MKKFVLLFIFLSSFLFSLTENEEKNNYINGKKISMSGPLAKKYGIDAIDRLNQKLRQQWILVKVGFAGDISDGHLAKTRERALEDLEKSKEDKN